MNGEYKEVYADGDIVIMDNVRELTQISPLKAQMNFIILCCQGRLQLDINGNRRELEKNDVLFNCPDVVLDNFMISPDFECKILCLSERIIHELLREHVGVWNRAVYICRTNVVSLTDDVVRLHSLYHALISQSMQISDRQFSKQAMQALIQSLLFELSSILYEPDTAEPQTYQTQSRQLFDRFLSMLSKEKVKFRPVGYYADLLSITPKYLTMVCEHESSKPAKDWINQYVVEDVRYYLRNTATPIKEIADRLGFANISHFGSYVRRHFGMSPSDCRSQSSQED
jgi:AraC-like DNA-binding protein